MRWLRTTSLQATGPDSPCVTRINVTPHFARAIIAKGPQKRGCCVENETPTPGFPHPSLDERGHPIFRPPHSAVIERLGYCVVRRSRRGRLLTKRTNVVDSSDRRTVRGVGLPSSLSPHSGQCCGSHTMAARMSPSTREGYRSCNALCPPFSRLDQSNLLGSGRHCTLRCSSYGTQLPTRLLVPMCL